MKKLKIEEERKKNENLDDFNKTKQEECYSNYNNDLDFSNQIDLHTNQNYFEGGVNSAICFKNDVR